MTAPVISVEIDFDTDLSAGFSYSQRVLSDGPYVYHQLRESAGTAATDASGNGVTGTYQDTYTLNQTSGKPVTGESASRYVNFGGSGTSAGNISFPMPEGEFPGNHLTLEMWIYQSSLSGSDATHYEIAADLTENTKFYLQGDGRLRLDSYAEGWETTSVVISAATWYHVVATIDAEVGEARIYVNGVPQSLTNVGIGDGSLFRLHYMRSPWYWGTSQNDPAGKGSISRIAEPAVYTYVLAPVVVDAHYDAAAISAFAGYTWTDVTDYVFAEVGMTRKFGRESETDDVTPMEIAYVLNNRDRRFEIENTESPYYPNVEAGRPTRIRMTYDAVTYDWAFGFIDDWPQDWDNKRMCRVPIRASCYLERLNQEEIGARTLNEQLTGARITVLLNAAGQPTSLRDLDAGAYTLMGQTVESGTAGDQARLAAKSDRGLLFFDARGYAVFQDGDARSTDTRSIIAQGEFGDPDFGEIPYMRPEFHAPAALIRNTITLRRPGGVDQTAVDAASRSRHGHRSYTDEVLLATDGAAATRAAELLADYKDQTLRIRALSFNPDAGDGFWVNALGVQISDRYMWSFRPELGSPISREVFVEGVSDFVRGGEYVSTWFLSLAPAAPAPAAGSFRGLLALIG
jgi:hypothetical protein